MSMLVKTFGACGIGVLLSGCASTTISGDCMAGVNAGPITTRSFSTKCAEHQVATTLVTSERPELQLVGATMYRNASPAVDRAFDEVKNGNGAPAPVKQERDCVVTGIVENKRSGVKTAQMSCN